MRRLRVKDIPKGFIVRPFLLHRCRKPAPPRTMTCGHCGLSWDDGKITSMTPVPSGRCPFEYHHRYDDES